MYPAPLDEVALAATWDGAWSALGLPAPAGLRNELRCAWDEPHRHYHDAGHLGECLALWQRWRGFGVRPGEVALALWFHDAVYDPRNGDNELHSAAWAARALVRAGASSEVAPRVHDLFMATQHDPARGTQHDATHDVSHDEPAHDVDVQLLLDIDLSVLGSPAERFERYDQDVRQEYAWVPGPRFRALRAQVLQGFLDRPRLYHGKAAVELLETQARINLAAALSRLDQ